MHKLPADEFYDRVYGCWLGKALAGTVGAPLEGRKELFDFQFEARLWNRPLPNDDLDLQVVWLEVLKKQGIHFTSADLARAFYDLCPYGPGEYGIFKKNFARGVNPPMSGGHNNRYYLNGMGSPIRAEIWACMAAGRPALAAALAQRDAVLDHAGDSVYAEQFIAALEASAFFERDLHRLIAGATPWLPWGTKIRRLVDQVVLWCAEPGSRWETVRTLILRDFGHADCTNLYQNIGITLIALLFGQGDLVKTTMIALNSGYDTDCTCATAGAILGIIQGAREMQSRYAVTDTGYILGVRLTPPDTSIAALARDVCEIAHRCFDGITADPHPWQAALSNTAAVAPFASDINFIVDYLDDPVVHPGRTKEVSLRFRLAEPRQPLGPVTVKGPSRWEFKLTLASAPDADGTIAGSLRVLVPSDIDALAEKNLVAIQVGERAPFRFGLVGAVQAKVYGPFIETWGRVLQPDLGLPYTIDSAERNLDRREDLLRDYHIVSRAAMDRVYIAEPGAGTPVPDAIRNGRTDATAFQRASLTEDRFAVGDLVNYQGPCVVYLERTVVSPDDRECFLYIGASDAFRLWINGALIAESDRVGWWTSENRHVSGIRLTCGSNRLLFKCARQTHEAWFSLAFATGRSLSDQVFDLASAI